MLSQLAKIWDPLGWLGYWDEPLNNELEEEWMKFAKQSLFLDRSIGTKNKTIMECHVFGDTSDKAYAALIYAKVGQQVKLLLAKSKENPIKNRKEYPN